MVSAAEVTCAIMNPELRPEFVAKNGGRPDSVGFTSCSTRRSLMAESCVSAMAMRSSACDTGCPWKLPPLTMSSSWPSAIRSGSPWPSANTSGLSVAAFASMESVLRTKASASREVPWTWGAQRSEYGSWTFLQSCPWCDGSISLPYKSSRRCCATAICPAWPRDLWIACRNGLCEPNRPSMVIAAAMSATRESCSASRSARMPTACIACVPFTSARPSLASGTSAERPTFCSAAAPGMRVNSGPTKASPSPIITSARCASGARSPDAPTEPFSGMTGTTPRISICRSRSSVDSRTPERPPARTLARKSMSARTSCGGSGVPVPAACERSRLRCSRRKSGFLIDTSASVPKPVLMP